MPVTRPCLGVAVIAAAIAAAPLAAPLNAWQETLTREGPLWVQKVTGIEPAGAPVSRLRVSTRGRVSVTGSQQDEQVRYIFIRKVKARSEDEARRLLGRFVVKSFRQADLCTVAVAHSGDAPGSADLQVIAPAGLRDIVIETFGGIVEASGLSGSVQAHSGGGRIRLDRIAGHVVAKTAGGEVILGTIGGSVRCISAGGPIRADLIKGEARLETAGGDITVREVGGPFYGSTAGGGIQIGKAGSTVVANTVGGVIDVGGAAGSVTAESQGGPIMVGSARGVKCETGGGAIRLTNISGALHASTAVGNIIARLVNAEDWADSFLGTGGGDITVFVPSNLGVTIRAQNESAASLSRIVSDFPGVRVRKEGPLVMAEGAINGGGPLLRLSSAGGTIYIRRQ